ncbi:hypothetical protein HHK36_013317 [Tetracentron sinense]|uniref:Uncharacterized protein n=1 Tax=Tetracentron sinense TaxID=13715 RepID=A0A835DFA3_TETSI|nr:hypothetical protein HHK36_013317 [Tetracentron sinense]
MLHQFNSLLSYKSALLYRELQNFNCPNLKELSLDFYRRENACTDLTSMVDGLGRTCPKLQNMLHQFNSLLSYKSALLYRELQNFNNISETIALTNILQDSSVTALFGFTRKCEIGKVGSRNLPCNGSSSSSSSEAIDEDSHNDGNGGDRPFCDLDIDALNLNQMESSYLHALEQIKFNVIQHLEERKIHGYDDGSSSSVDGTPLFEFPQDEHYSMSVMPPTEEEFYAISRICQRFGLSDAENCSITELMTNDSVGQGLGLTQVEDELWNEDTLDTISANGFINVGHGLGLTEVEDAFWNDGSLQTSILMWVKDWD